MTNRSRTGCGFFHRLRRNFTMIVVLKHNPNPEQLQSLITWLQE